jgi:hypothetical protein
MQFCIPSLQSKNASPFAFPVGGLSFYAQWSAGGKNAFASRCWIQSKWTHLHA